MTRRSHHSASSMPPATAGPSTAAMTGLDSSSRVGPRGPRGSLLPSVGKSSEASGLSPSRLAAYFMSHPAQKAPPSPHNLARDCGWLVAIRGGGHNGAGLGTCSDGLVIDLSSMKGIRVDPQERTVRVDGGCTWGDVDHATHAF